MNLPDRKPDFIRNHSKYWFGDDMICHVDVSKEDKPCGVFFKLTIKDGDLCYEYPHREEIQFCLVPTYVRVIYDHYLAENIILA